MENPKIDGVEILGVTLKFSVPVNRHLYDLGSVSLKSGERNFVLDICQSRTNEECTEIDCDLEIDTDTFPVDEENNYQLTAEDLMFGTTGSLYIGDDWGEEPESITLFVKFEGGMTKAIDISIE